MTKNQMCEACIAGAHKNCDIFVEETGRECSCMKSDCIYLRVITNQN